jgi:hypothetical protein
MAHLSTEYELLVRDLHAALVRNDQVENVDVRHNVRIAGRSGATHQIDVYWEFRIAGVTYKTCIECKHYNKRVKKSEVAAFITTMSDIGNVTGIFATTVGYQRGATLLAQQNGLRLITVNHLLKSVCITSHVIAPYTDILNIKYDLVQAKQRLKEKGLASYSLTPRWDNSTMFSDAQGNPIKTLKELMNESIAEDGRGAIRPVNCYENTEIGLVRVDEIEYRRTTQVFKSSSEVMLNDTARAIMEDVLENKAHYLHDDGSISAVEI